jgi:hypothetical protein
VKIMGLESHVNAVIVDSNPNLIGKYWWSKGLNVEDDNTGKEIIKILNDSYQFGKAHFNKVNKTIRFDVFER